MPRCVEMGHVFNCPRHPEAYCIDKEGETCVLCEEAERRFERTQIKAKRRVRETEVAAALAARADPLTAGKVRWDDKLPTLNKLAKTAANKAQQASKTTDTQETRITKVDRVWKGAKGGKQVKIQQAKEMRADETPKAELDNAHANPRLRIQRGR